MSVAQILQQMAESAGRKQLARGQLLGQTISDLGQIPGQILDARAQQRIDQARMARQQQQDAMAADTYQRRVAGETREDAARVEAQRQKEIAHQIITVYHAGTPNDPTTNNLQGAIDKAKELGAPEFIEGLVKTDRAERDAAQPKVTQLDREKDTYENGVLVRPGVAKPPEMGTPGYEIWLRQQALLQPPDEGPGAAAPGVAAPPTASSAPAAGVGGVGNFTPEGSPVAAPTSYGARVTATAAPGAPVSAVGAETTKLAPAEERAFQQWATANHVENVDAPESRYDMRGYWKDVASKGGNETKVYADGLHFPDTYKQHGHPTFSEESKYSRGAGDGGTWNGETFVPGRPATTTPAAKRPLTANEAALQAYEDQRTATAKDTHSPAFKEWQDYKASGGPLDFNGYQTMDANRRRSVTVNNAPTDNKMVDEAARNILANPRDLTSIKNITTLRGDQRLKLFNRLKELDPTFNVGNIDRQIKFVDSYEDPKGKPAMNRQSMNNILMHSADLSDVNQEYRRFDVKIANLPLNKIKSQYSEAYEKYATTIAVLKDEISLYFAGGYAPTVAQGKTWDKILNDEVPPNMVEAFAKQIIHVGLRRASTHNSDFKSVMGYDDPNLITPDAVAAGVHLGLGEAMKPFGSGGTLGGRPPTAPPKRIVYGMDGKPVK